MVPHKAYNGTAVMSGNGKLELELEGWDSPQVIARGGAEFCHVALAGPQAPETTARVDLELDD